MSAPTGTPPLTPVEFSWFQAFLRERTGIELRAGKETLVAARLERRLRECGLSTMGAYIDLLSVPGSGEETTAVDLLTTDETSFFREADHFDLLSQLLQTRTGTGPVRVWSAASSTGEEAFSAALVLADRLGTAGWEVLGTDVSHRVLARAQQALYPLEAAGRIPDRFRERFCLKGRGSSRDSFTFRAEIRANVSFRPADLTGPLPEIGTFDVVLLRNVLLYFGEETRRELVHRVVKTLRPGGHLLIGHAESISGLHPGLTPLGPSVHRYGGEPS